MVINYGVQDAFYKQAYSLEQTLKTALSLQLSELSFLVAVQRNLQLYVRDSWLEQWVMSPLKGRYSPEP